MSTHRTPPCPAVGRFVEHVRNCNRCFTANRADVRCPQGQALWSTADRVLSGAGVSLAKSTDRVPPYRPSEWVLNLQRAIKNPRVTVILGAFPLTSDMINDNNLRALSLVLTVAASSGPTFH